MGKMKEHLLLETEEAEERFASGKDNERVFKKRMRNLGYTSEYIQDRIDALGDDWSE